MTIHFLQLAALFLVINFTMSFTGPIALNVKVSIKPERRAEFLTVIQKDAADTLATEPGALQFTLGQDVDDENCFYFHEQYKTMSDFDHHTTTPHFAEWMAFCATDPFTKPTEVNKYQCSHTVGDQVPKRSAYCLNVELCIQPNLRDEFLKVIVNNKIGSTTKEPLCLQYDYGESLDTPNSFYFHEQYSGSDGGKEGFDAHTKAPHFAVWEEFAAKGPFTKDPVIGFFRTVD